MKRIVLILCIVALLCASLVSCGKTMSERAEELVVGMTYLQVAEIMGEKGELADGDATVYSWELEEGKTLLVTFDVPLEDGHGVDDGHGHTFDFPNDFVVKSIVTE